MKRNTIRDLDEVFPRESRMCPPTVTGNHKATHTAISKGLAHEEQPQGLSNASIQVVRQMQDSKENDFIA